MQKFQATSYLRLSHADDKENESDSITNQRRLIEDFVSRNADIEIVSERADDGYSGVIFDRPAFKEMMDDVSLGKINCIIVKDLSRLGRDYIEMGHYLRRVLPAYGVRFIAVTDNIDTLKETDSDGMTISIKNIMNDAYCKDISVKTRSALAAKRENGEYIGASAIYGYRKDIENKNQLVVDEYASKIVQDIFRMKMEGMSASVIADNLNSIGVLSPLEYKKSKGIPHSKGGFADKENSKWSATTIIRILKDETYTGVLLQGKQSTFSYKLKNIIEKPPSEWIRTENAHEAIIRKHDFELIQRIIHLDTRTSPNEKNVYLFSGILICGRCGNRMTRKTNTYKDKKYFYYYCPTGKKNGCETSQMIKENDLTDCVFENIKSHIESVVILEELWHSVNAEKINKELVKKYTSQITENKTQLEQINAYKASLYENFVNNILDKDEYKKFKDSYSEDAERLKNAITKLKEELESVMNNTVERLRWIEHFKRFGNLQEISRKAVMQLVKNIIVKSKGELQITFNYQPEYEKAMEIFSKGELEMKVV